MSFRFDQLAMRTANIGLTTGQLDSNTAGWIRDTVRATHLYANHVFRLGTDFEVQLAFHYQLFPGLEYELIQLMSGATCQLTDGRPGDLSHYGYHIADQLDDPSRPDALVQELRRLQVEEGMEPVQVSQTTHHTGTIRRYRYAFVYGNGFPAPLKIIQRLHAARLNDLDEGKELFSWLR